MDFTRNHNEDCLDEFAKSFNEDSHQDLYGNGILDVISNDYTEFVSPKWVRLALHYLFFHSLNLEMSGQIEYVNAATVNVKRLYRLDSSDRFGNMWKTYNNLSHNPHFQGEGYDLAENYWEGKTGEFMRKWLRELGICDEINIENIEGSLRIKMFSEEYPEGRLLADQGYGITQLVALLLNIEIALNKIVQYDLIYVGLNHEVGPGYVGYKHSWLIVEEPEVHLHPSLQSRLTDIFLDASRHGLRFIVETHSEYLVRRSQVVVADMNLKDEDLAYKNPFRVYYFPESKPPYDMNYRPDGCFLEEFGTGFFDEASKLAFKLF